MRYFMDRGLVQDNLESKAAFLHAENQRLDKTSLGEYLGDVDCKELMHTFVDLMNFSNMEFLKALRYFLEGFRLPGKSLLLEEKNPSQFIKYFKIFGYFFR